MSFRLTASKQVIIDFFSTLKVVAEEAAFRITHDGLTAVILDLSRTAILHTNYPKTLFSHYTLTAQQKIALNTALMLEYLNRTTDDDQITLSRNHEAQNNNTLTITAYNPALKLTREWTQPLMIIPPDDPTPVDSTYTTQIILSAPPLAQRFEDLALVGSHITFDAKKDSLILTTKSDTSDAAITLPITSTDALIELGISKPAQASYCAQYLIDIAKAAKTNNLIVLFAQNAPMKIKYQLETAKTVFWLSPRIIEEQTPPPTQKAASP